MISESRIKTNLLLMEDLGIEDYLFEIKSNDNKNTRKYYKDLSRMIEGQFSAAVEWLDSEEGKKYYKEEGRYRKEAFESLDEVIDELAKQTSLSADEIIEKLYQEGVNIGYDKIRRHVRYTDADKIALKFAQTYNYNLITNLTNDIKNTVKNEIFRSVLGGRTIGEIRSQIYRKQKERLEGTSFTPYQRAGMIARTETSRAKNTGILQSYVNEGVRRVKVLTAEDSSVCVNCLEYAYEYDSDRITIENRGAERSHKILDVVKKGTCLPLHPNCRCTYVADLDNDLLPPRNPEAVNLNPLSNEQLIVLLTRKENIKLDTPEKLAEYYKLQLTKMENGGYEFYDKKNNCKIEFPVEYVKNKSYAKGLLDFTNKGGCNYNLRDVIESYYLAPKALKKATNKINFIDKTEEKSSTLASSGLTINGVKRSILIYPNALLKYNRKSENFQRTLYHEMGHCLDYIFIDKKKWEKLDKYKITANNRGILKGEGISTNKVDEFYFDALNDKKSSKKEYEHILYDDYLYQDHNGLKEQFASYYAYNNGKPKIFEDWAESVSMVSFDKLSKKEQQNALIWNEYDEELDLKAWRRLHKKRYEYFLNLLEDS